MTVSYCWGYVGVCSPFDRKPSTVSSHFADLQTAKALYGRLMYRVKTEPNHLIQSYGNSTSRPPCRWELHNPTSPPPSNYVLKRWPTHAPDASYTPAEAQRRERIPRLTARA